MKDQKIYSPVGKMEATYRAIKYHTKRLFHLNRKKPIQKKV